MGIVPLPKNEAKRLAALRQYELLDTSSDPAYDAFASLAAKLCDVPIGLISLVDSSRQWFKAKVGLDGASETARDLSFCAHAIVSKEILEVPDARLDARFADNPFVTGDPHIRFYAGMPLVDSGGNALGTLCTLDRRPRNLSGEQRSALALLASTLVTLIEKRKGVPAKTLEQIALVSGGLEHAAVPVAILNLVPTSARPTIAFVNRAFTDLFGYEAPELIGKTPHLLHGAATDQAKIARLRDDVVGGKDGSETVYLYTAKGERLLVEIRDRAIDASHRIASFRDLTRIHATQEALSLANQRLGSLIANNTSAVLTIDAHGNCVDANAAAATVFHCEREELLGSGFLTLTGGRLIPEAAAFPESLKTGQTMDFTAIYRRRDGKEITIECKAIPMHVLGVAEGAYIIANDVTEAVRAASFIAEQSKRTRALYHISAARGTTDAKQIDAALAFVLEAFDMQFGYVGEVIDGSFHVTHVAGEEIVKAGEAFELHKTHVCETLAFGDVLAIDDLSSSVNRKAGVPDYPLWHGYISAPLAIDGCSFGAIGFLSRKIVAFNDFDRDFVRLVAALVSSALERNLKKQRLDRLAYYDILTKLPNRAKFLQDLDEATIGGQRDRRAFAVLFIDLDGFKDVNDRLGHAFGDLALQETGRRLRETLRRAEDVPARLGGDEFVILQASIGHPSEAEALGNRIVEVLSQPYVLGERTVHLSASVGIAIFPDDGHDAKALLRSADLALYRAKTGGKNRIEFSAYPAEASIST